MIDEQAYLRALDAADQVPNEVNCRLVVHLSRKVLEELIRLRLEAARNRTRALDLEAGQKLMPL